MNYLSLLPKELYHEILRFRYSNEQITFKFENIKSIISKEGYCSFNSKINGRDVYYCSKQLVADRRREIIIRDIKDKLIYNEIVDQDDLKIDDRVNSLDKNIFVKAYILTLGGEFVVENIDGFNYKFRKIGGYKTSFIAYFVYMAILILLYFYVFHIRS